MAECRRNLEVRAARRTVQQYNAHKRIEKIYIVDTVETHDYYVEFLDWLSSNKATYSDLFST